MKVRIGIDIGATSTRLIMITRAGKVIDRVKIRTESDGQPGPIVDKCSRQVRGLLKKHKKRPSQVESVAVGIAGFSNPKTGYIDISPNLHWHEVPFIELMEESLAMKVYMANDVNSAAWGEFVYGVGQGAQDMVAIFVGSGIGGGIVANGRLVEGATGTAGEVGHMIFRPAGLLCDCGRRGCFEAYGGGMPMERRMRRAVKKGHGRLALKMAKSDLEKINTRVIRMAADKGDRTAKRIWKEAEQALGFLCANLASLLNPDMLVIGGGVLQGSPGLMKTIRRTVDEQSVSLSGRHVKVVGSKLGEDAVAMGAAALVDLYRK